MQRVVIIRDEIVNLRTMRRREVHDNALGAILLGHHPEGEHWRLGKGGDRKGLAVWLLDTSLARAAEMASG